MFRLIFLFALLPSLAAAQWSPRPTLFSFDATFDVCTADPTTPDLAGTCTDLLNAAYALKRSVAIAAVECQGQNLRECALPFEDQGLPAIAVRIAVDVGCDDINMTTLPQDQPLPENHCVAVASNVMIDEGVVPLITDIPCASGANQWSACSDLAMIQKTAWENALREMTGDDPLILDLIARIKQDCGEGDQAGTATNACVLSQTAALWADVAQNQGNN